MTKSNEIEFKAHLSRDELIQQLHALADSIASGRVVIEQGQRIAELEPSERAELELEAVQKQGKSKLSLEISWHAPLAAAGRELFRISSEVPQERPPVEAE